MSGYNVSEGDEVWISRTLRISGSAKKILFPKGTARIWAMQPREEGDALTLSRARSTPPLPPSTKTNRPANRIGKKQSLKFKFK